jgi:hypothetical protein
VEAAALSLLTLMLCTPIAMNTRFLVQNAAFGDCGATVAQETVYTNNPDRAGTATQARETDT